MGGTGVGIYGSGWHDSGIRGGILRVGSHHVCGKRGGVWMGAVGACGGGAGGVFVGICEYTTCISEQCTVPGLQGMSVTDASDIATFRQLLRPHLHPLRAFLPLPQLSLVFR